MIPLRFMVYGETRSTTVCLESDAGLSRCFFLDSALLDPGDSFDLPGDRPAEGEGLEAEVKNLDMPEKDEVAAEVEPELDGG